jgi:hypothetical protein
MSGGSMGNPSDEANATLFLTDHDVRSALSMEMTSDALKRSSAIVGGEGTGRLSN